MMRARSGHGHTGEGWYPVADGVMIVGAGAGFGRHEGLPRRPGLSPS